MKPLEGGKISGRQFLSLIVLVRVVAMIVFFPALTATSVGRDGWIASIISGLLAIPFVLTVVGLGRRFPDKTIIEYSGILLGKVLGKIIGAIILWQLFHITVYESRAFGESIAATILDQTPVQVIMLLTLALSANAARNGLEIVGRMAENALPIVLFFLFMTFVLPYNNMDFGRVYPILSRGFSPVLGSVAVSLSFYTEFIVFGMVMPYLNNQKGSYRAMIFGTLLSMFLMTALSLILVSVFGPTTSGLALPAFSLGRMIDIYSFLERTEIIPIGAWVLAAGIKQSFFLWSVVVGFAQLLGLSEYKSFAYPVAAVTLSCTMWFYQSSFALHRFFAPEVFGVYSVVFEVIVVLLLFVVAVFKGISKKNKEYKEEAG